MSTTTKDFQENLRKRMQSFEKNAHTVISIKKEICEMKHETSCQEGNHCSPGKWIVTVSAIVGFLGMATVFTLWLCKKYKKCTAVFTDDGTMDCLGSCDDEQ